jgi:hypothetical protein
MFGADWVEAMIRVILSIHEWEYRVGGGVELM